MLGYLLYLVCPAAAIVLFIVNRDNRNKNINGEKMALIHKAKKQFSLDFVLMKIIPILIFIVGIILNILIFTQNIEDIKNRYETESNDLLISNMNYIMEKDKTVNEIWNMIIDCSFSFSVALAAYTIIYIIFMQRLKKNKKLSEESKNAMIEYYKNRTLYLVLIIVSIFAYSALFKMAINVEPMPPV